MVPSSGLSRGSTRMGSKRRWVSRSTSTSPLDGTCVAGMLTGPAGQGDVAETVLGIVGVVVVPVVVTVDEATLGLAARINVRAIITRTTNLPDLVPVDLRGLLKGGFLL